MTYRPESCLFTQFSVDGDSGPTQVIVANDTLSILGDGNRLTTVASASDIVSINYDLCGALTDLTSSGVIPSTYQVVGTDGTACGRFDLPIYSVADTNCIDLTITAGVLTADPIINGSALNLIQCTPTGLLAVESVVVFTADGVTTGVTQSGTADHTVDITLLSTDALNVLQKGTDGGLWLSCEEIQDCVGQAINAATNGIIAYNDAGDTINIVPSSDANNIFTSGTDGKPYVQATQILVTDTSCIDFTISGNGTTSTPFNISATPIISPNVDNGLVCLANGLYAPAATVINVLDTTCIDMTITGSGTAASPYVVSATPIIDPATNNVATCTANGLFTPDLCTQLQGTAAGVPATGDTILALNGTTCKRITPNFTVVSNGAGSVSQTIDFGNTLNINGSGLATAVSSATDTVTVTVLCEDVQDCVGPMLAGRGFVYNDAANVWDTTGTAGQVLSADGAGGGVWFTIPANFITSVADTNCIDLTVAAGVLTADPIISATAGNSITCTATGLYAPDLCTSLQSIATGAPATGDTILALNGTTCKRITPNFTVISNGAGSVSQTIDFGNTLNINGAGLATVVSSATDTVTVTVLCEDVQDCVGTMLSTVGFVYNDTANRFDSAGTVGQVLTTDGAGAASWTTIPADFITAIADTSCIDLTVTGTTLSAAPILNPSTNNLLTCTPTGLMVDCSTLYAAGTVATGRVLVQADADCQIETLAATACPGDVLTSAGDGVNVVWAKPSNGYTPVRTVSASTTATATDGLIRVDATAGPVTVTLPACNACTPNTFTVKKIDSSANAVTVVGSGGALIDGLANFSTACAQASATFVCDGTNWSII